MQPLQVLLPYGGNKTVQFNNTITRNSLTGTSSTRAVYISSPAVFKNNNIYRNMLITKFILLFLQSTPSINARKLLVEYHHILPSLIPGFMIFLITARSLLLIILPLQLLLILSHLLLLQRMLSKPIWAEEK